MLVAGDRVRCTWSGKVGRVLTPRVPTRVGHGEPPGVLVLLDPFWPRWAGEAVARLDCPAHLTGLEVIYDLRDLEPL